MTQKTTEYRRLFTPELLTVLFICAVAFCAGELLTPIFPLYMANIGMDARTIGLMFSVMMAGIAISEVFWGWVVDRVDLKIAIFMGTVVYGIIMSTMTFAKTLPLFVILIFIYGFCRSPIFIVGRWYMGVYAPSDMKSFAMALLGTIIGVFQAIGSFASGYITQAWGYRVTFYIAAGLSVTAGIMIMIAGRWLNFQNHKQNQEEPALKVQKPVTVSREVKLFTVSLGMIGTLYFISLGIYGTYLPLFASNTVHLETSMIGILFGIRGLISVVAQIPLGRLADRYNKWHFLPIGLGFVALSMAGMAFSGSYLGLVVFVLLFALGSAILIPNVTAILSQSIPAFWTGTAMGVYGLMEDVGWMIGPAIGGMIWMSWSKPATFIFSGIVTMLGIPLVVLVRRRFSNMAVIRQNLEVKSDLKLGGD